MSGGFFDYENYKILDIANSIEEYLDKQAYELEPRTKDEFRNAIYLLRKAEIYAERIDYLLCADDGEETFHDRLKKDLFKLDEKMNRQVDSNICTEMKILFFLLF